MSLPGTEKLQRIKLLLEVLLLLLLVPLVLYSIAIDRKATSALAIGMAAR